MDPFQLAVVLGVLAVFAHVVKGLTGFGPAVVFVSIGSLIYDPVKVIVLAAVLDTVGGAYLSYLNPRFFRNRRYWVSTGLLMISGAVIGSLALSILPATLFEYLLGSAIVLISLWFILGKAEPDAGSENSFDLGLADGVVGVFSGFCGGFTGMGGPPLIAYLGNRLDKEMLRAIITPIFLMSTAARVSTYGFLGMMPTGNLWLFLFPPLGVLAGNYIGNRLFEDVEQKGFTLIVGVILMLSGIRLLAG